MADIQEATKQKGKHQTEVKEVKEEEENHNLLQANFSLPFENT